MWLKCQCSSQGSVCQAIELLTELTLTQNHHNAKKEPWHKLELDQSLMLWHLDHTPFASSITFQPCTIKQGVVTSRASSYSQLTTVTLQSMFGKREL